MPTPLSAIRLSVIRRWHKWWFWPIEIAALLALVGWHWYANHSPMGRLRASGAPITFEDLVPESIPDEENIAAGLRDLKSRIAKVPDGLYNFAADFGDLDDPSERLDEAQEWLRPQADLIEKLKEVARRPSYVSLMPAAVMADPQGMLDYPQKVRPVARLLTLEAHTAIATGDLPRAVEATTASLRFARAWEVEPFVVGRLIACATQSMALRDADRLADHDNLTAEQADSLSRGVQKLEDRSSARYTLISERVISIAKLSETPVWGTLSQSAVLRVFEQALPITETPVTEWVATSKTVSPQTRDVLASTIAPLLQSWFESEARVAGEARAVRERLERRLAE